MNYCIFYDKNKNNSLVYNSQTPRISWEPECSSADFDQAAANAFLIRIDEVIRTCPPDIEIFKVKPGNFLRITDEKGKKYLVLGRRQIGEIEKEYDWDTLKEIGGAIISQLTKDGKRIIHVIFVPKNQMVSKNQNKINGNPNLFSETFIERPLGRIIEKPIEKSIEKPIEEYYEGIIRIPKPLVQSDDLTKRLLEADVQIYKRISEMNAKMDRVLEISERGKLQELYISQRQNEEKLLKTIEDLQKQNQTLVAERQYLNKLIEESKTIALNNLKEEFKFSKVALDRQVDLDQFPAAKEFIELLIKEILQLSGVKDDQIMEMLKEDIVSTKLRDFSDSIDSKIQSLKEIKKEFIDLNILETGGEK